MLTSPGTPTSDPLTYPYPAYIVDHFSKAGVEESINYWSAHLLSDKLRPLLKK